MTDTLAQRIHALPAPGDPALAELWQPLVFELARPEDRAALADLRGGGRVWEIHDTLAVQLADLVRTRAPGRALTTAERDHAVAALLDGATLDGYGRWVFYPWSGQLVHLLGPRELRELRHDRNRNKITAAEQARLAEITVGIVGLSVGNSIAFTIAQEGSAGHLKLADFDRLDLSNLNRLHGGVHEIGVRKTVLAARQIVELDPDVRLTLFHDGLTEANLDEFIGGAPRLDVLVDECDGLMMKFLMRQKARAAGVPVVMETNDRGMLDVERFDSEPARPLFHGLSRTTDPEALRAVPSGDRVSVVLDIIGAATMSARLGASLIEVDRTISTWPQLGGDVALGGATVATAVRRIALGHPMESGRRYVDLEEILARTGEAGAHAEAGTAVAPESPSAALAGVSPIVQHLLEAAALAPSGGNTQPWQFRVDGDTIRVLHDRTRGSLLDANGRAPRLALGAAIENMVVAAAGRGLALEVRPFPVAGHDEIVAEVKLAGPAGAAEEALARLAPFVGVRHTNRRLGERVPLTAAEIDALAAAAGADASFDLRAGDDEIAACADLLAEGDRLRFTVRELHAGMFAEVRLTAEENARTRDGIDLETLEMSPKDRAGLHVLARADVMATLRAQGGGGALGDSTRRALAASSAVVLMRTRGEGPAAELAGGRAVERVWLTAAAAGLALQPLGALPYMIDLLDQPARSIFTDEEAGSLRDLDRRLERLFSVAAGQPRLFLFRLARSPATTNRSLRRPLAEVVEVMGGD